MEQRTSLTEIIEYIDPGSLNYQDWVNVGMALKLEGYPVSVWDPNLNIEEKTYTTKEPSRPITKEIRLKGHWRLTSPMENVRLEQQGDQTVLTVTCQHGQPVEMLMENK